MEAASEAKKTAEDDISENSAYLPKGILPRTSFLKCLFNYSKTNSLGILIIQNTYLIMELNYY